MISPQNFCLNSSAPGVGSPLNQLRSKLSAILRFFAFTCFLFFSFFSSNARFILFRSFSDISFCPLSSSSESSPSPSPRNSHNTCNRSNITSTGFLPNSLHGILIFNSPTYPAFTFTFELIDDIPFKAVDFTRTFLSVTSPFSKDSFKFDLSKPCKRSPSARFNAFAIWPSNTILTRCRFASWYY